MADGLFYNDTRAPFIGADIAAVTLAATNKALYPVSNFPVLGGQYFNFIGKKLSIKLFGRMTTGATPGNLTLGILYGTGADDANGVVLASSAAVALTASQTNMSWKLECAIHCRSLGNAGTLFATGNFEANPAVLASTLQPMMIPATAPVVSGACDLTAALIISVQALRSGSTAETMQVHDMKVISRN
jgi:hypothetical protein